MLALGFFGWIIIGGLAGQAAGKVMKTGDRQDITRTIGLGIVGGLIGGFILGLCGVDVRGGRFLFSFCTCLAGAVLLIWGADKLTGKRI